MKRIFVLVPTFDIIQAIVHELNEVGIKDNDVHIYGGMHEALKRAHLPEASIFQTTDIIPALKRGALVGIILSGLLYALFTLGLSPDIKINALGISAILFFGIFFGVWASSLVGIGIKNPVVVKYQSYVNQGHFILMIDCPDEREHEIASRVVRHHPGAEIAVLPRAVQ